MRNRIVATPFALILVFTMPIKSASYAVPTNNIIEEKYNTTSRSISQALGRTAIYAMEELSGLIGTCVGSWSGIFITAVMGYVLLPRLGFDIEPESETYRTYSAFFIYYPMTATGAATGTTCTGKILRQKGSFTGALIGSALVITAVAFPEYLAHKYHLNDDIFESPWLELLFFPSIGTGAVIGYNYELFKSDKKELLYCLIGCTLSSIAYIFARL